MTSARSPFLTHAPLDGAAAPLCPVCLTDYDPDGFCCVCGRLRRPDEYPVPLGLRIQPVDDEDDEA